MNATQVIHLAAGAFHTACGKGGEGFEVSVFEQDVTCLDCRAEIDVAEAINRVPTDPAALAAATAELEEMFPDDGPAVSGCVFCSILAGQAPGTVVREWDDAVALVTISPYTAGHVLVVPRAHVPDLAADPAVTGAVMARAAELARDTMASANILTSWGEAATQTVPHLHVHVVPRVEGDRAELGLWPWPRWAQLRAVFHAAGPDGSALCGSSAGTASARWADATCPQCAELTTGGLAVHGSGHLDDALAALEAQRSALRTALGIEQGQAEQGEAPEPAIACTLVHEHDEVACAAPSTAELMLDTVGSHLRGLWARIEKTFETGGDRQYALKGAQQEIGNLLGLLGLSVPAAGMDAEAVPEPPDPEPWVHSGPCIYVHGPSCVLCDPANNPGGPRTVCSACAEELKRMEAAVLRGDA